MDSQLGVSSRDFFNPIYEELPLKEEAKRVPPPIKPRLTLIRKRLLEQQQQQQSATEPGEANSQVHVDEVYDEPLACRPPPSYPPPPPPLPPFPAKRESQVNGIQTDSRAEEDELPGYLAMDELAPPKPPRRSQEDNNYASLSLVKEVDEEVVEEEEEEEDEEIAPPVPPRLWNRSPASSSASSDYDKYQPRVISQLKSVPSSTSLHSLPPAHSVSAKTNLVRSNTMPAIRPSKATESTPSTSSHEPQNKGTLCPDVVHSKGGSRESVTSKASQGSSFISISNQPSIKYGFLYKTGADRKLFLKRWVTLDRNSITYYADEPSMTTSPPKLHSLPKGVIYLKDIAFIGKSLSSNVIGIHPNSRFHKRVSTRQRSNSMEPASPGTEQEESQGLWYFEIGVVSHKGRHFLFGSQTEEVGRSWMEVIACAIGPKVGFGIIASHWADCCGYLKVKMGISGIWSTCWLIITGRELHLVEYRDEDGREQEDLMSIDLRKVMSVSYASVHQINSCASVLEQGQPISINRPQENVLYLQGNITSHTETWYQLILKQWFVPCIGLLKDQFLTADNVPVAVDKCLNFISTYGGLTTRGIYRLTGQSSQVRSIVDALKTSNKKLWDLHLRPEDGYTVHDVVSALKKYLLSFSDCILTEALAEEWLKNNTVEDREVRLRNIKILLTQLPTVNYATLKRIIGHLCCVVENAEHNHMSLLNIAPVLGPILFFVTRVNRDSSLLTSSSLDIVSDLVSSYIWLFDVSREDMEKEKRIQEALVLLREAKMLTKPAEDILVGVYIYNKEWGKCLNVRLTPTMTSEQLIQYVVKTANLKDSLMNLSVYEVVCCNQLERVLHFSEIVLGVTLSWSSNWSSEDAKENYLVVKTNEIYQKVGPYLGPMNFRTSTIPFTLFSELKFSDTNSGKSFKKVLFEFIGAKLSVYKDAKASKVIGQWNIEEITWYLGAETKRCPPTRFCLTFVERNTPIKRTRASGGFIGRCVCCNTEEEYYKWIAGMVTTEYPNGLYPPRPEVDLLA